MTDRSAPTLTSIPVAPATRLLPVDDDLDTGGYFDAARLGELVIRRCNTCDSVLHMPRMYCRHCRSWDGRWARVSGKGSVYSWTVVTHQVHPAYPIPYTVILVDLDDNPGTRLVGQLPGTPELEAGMPLEVWFESVGEIDGRNIVLPQWRLVGTRTG